MVLTTETSHIPEKEKARRRRRPRPQRRHGLLEGRLCPGVRARGLHAQIMVRAGSSIRGCPALAGNLRAADARRVDASAGLFSSRTWCCVSCCFPVGNCRRVFRRGTQPPTFKALLIAHSTDHTALSCRLASATPSAVEPARRRGRRQWWDGACRPGWPVLSAGLVAALDQRDAADSDVGQFGQS